MKKRIITSMLFLSFLLVGTVAQENTAETSSYIPTKGDMAIGINAAPIFNYVGNMFNGSESNSLSTFGGQAVGGVITDMAAAYVNLATGGTSLGSAITRPFTSIMGKYMLTDNMAITANVGLISLGVSLKEYVQDDAAVALDPLSNKEVVDHFSISAKGASIAVGTQWFKTRNKLRAYVGTSLLYASVGLDSKFSYGNAITEINQTPSVSTWYDPVGHLPAARPLNGNMMLPGIGNINALGAIGSLGLEWFFMPKVSLGGEVTFSLLYGWQSEMYNLYEGYSPLTQKVEIYKEKEAPGSSGFIIGTENLGSNVFVHFYF